LKAIADTSSLIHPAKVRKFWRLMRNTFEEILVPNAVYQEILKGKEIGSPDVPVIEEAVREGWIRVKKTSPKKGLPDNLGRGEKEAMTLMQNEPADWLLMDDLVASTTARLMGIEVRPAVYLLIYWTRKGVTTRDEAIRMLDELVGTGYRLSSKDYLAIKELILV
jgi:predicted nucleic acid-binding protein